MAKKSPQFLYRVHEKIVDNPEAHVTLTMREKQKRTFRGLKQLTLKI